MNFSDKQLQCLDCHKDFTFSAAEQEFYSDRGFPNNPSTCPPCRHARKKTRVKDENASEDFSARRQVYPVTCFRCGRTTRLPFQPRANEPVYCSDCYIKGKSSRS
jgi:CxxC-x17-CxxC domain-containing protein